MMRFLIYAFVTSKTDGVKKFGEVRGTWIWPAHEGERTDPGGVSVSLHDGELWIDTVARPSDMPVGGKFCSRALPAALNAFLADKNIADIDSVNVVNNAEPWEAGCRCYTRVMVRMGFTTINRNSLDESKVGSFCQNRRKSNIIRAIAPVKDAIRLPMISEEEADFFKFSHFKP
jgi:hypothetical protein